MDATAQAFAGPPETDDRKQDGSQLDVEALLRRAMLGRSGDSSGSDFSVATAGTTPPPRTSAPMTPAEPQPANPYIPPDPSKAPGNLAPSSLTPAQVPKAPTGSNNPDRAFWTKQQAEDMKPLDRSAVDPATGKPKYKMGWGQRILGTVANFANGFARDGAAPIYVGPGATNWKYSRDEATRQQNVARDTTALGEQEKLDVTNQKAYEDAERQAYQGQLGEAREKLGSAAEENAATKASLVDSERQLKLARAGKLDQNPSDQRAADADKYVGTRTIASKRNCP
jgi:hypothetical protein